MADLKIAIILGSTREGRNGEAVAKWVLDAASTRTAASYELIDLRDYPLPMFNEPISPAYAPSSNPDVVAFASKIGEFDGYVFVTPEYNHSISGVLKNAIDYVYSEWNDKAAAFVSYGAFNGARAVEQLRAIASEMQLAHVRQQLGFSLFTDFEGMAKFTPGDQHVGSAEVMFTQLEAWSGAMKSVRASALVSA